MHFIDIIILTPLLYGFYKGFKNGLIFELISLISLFIAVFIALKFSGQLEHFLVEKNYISLNYSPFIAFIISFLGAMIVIQLTGKVLNKIIETVQLKFINKLMGAGFGTLKYFVFVGALLLLTNRINQKLPFLPEDSIQQSKLFLPTLKIAELLLPTVQKWL